MTKTTAMQLFDQYERIRTKLFDYFGYVEDWRVIPVDFQLGRYWRLNGTGPGEVQYADSVEELNDQGGNYYVNEIYTQRHLPKWVYRGADFTMVVVDTHCDGNQFLQIFDNAKETA